MLKGAIGVLLDFTTHYCCFYFIGFPISCIKDWMLQKKTSLRTQKTYNPTKTQTS
jgi:hypothetical protein